MRTMTYCAVAVSALLLVACGGDPAGEGEIAEGCDAIDLAPPAPGEGVQLTIDMDLDAGAERQICKLVPIGQKVNLNWTEGLFSDGSHHALVWRTTYRDALPTANVRGETVDASLAVDCENAGSEWSVTNVVAGGRALHGDPASSFPNQGDLPSNVALKIEANEILQLNFHMLNTDTKPTHACYKANLYSVPDEQVEVEAGTIFYYNNFITLPASGTATASMACPVSEDVTLRAQVSHMHKRGTGYTASLLDDDPLAGGQEVQKLYETTDWDEPVFKIDDPALALTTGQWIRWNCDYTNPEARDVAQGQQTTDEMCMFVGVYWPRSASMDGCTSAGGQYMSASRPLGTGTMNGAQLMDCFNTSPQLVTGGGPETSADRYATQRCVTEACPEVSGRVNEGVAGLVDLTTLTCN